MPSHKEMTGATPSAKSFFHVLTHPFPCFFKQLIILKLLVSLKLFFIGSDPFCLPRCRDHRVSFAQT